MHVGKMQNQPIVSRDSTAADGTLNPHPDECEPIGRNEQNVKSESIPPHPNHPQVVKPQTPAPPPNPPTYSHLCLLCRALYPSINPYQYHPFLILTLPTREFLLFMTASKRIIHTAHALPPSPTSQQSAHSVCQSSEYTRSLLV